MPLYSNASGSLQVSDLLFVLLAIFFVPVRIASGRKLPKLPARRLLDAHGYFVIYVVVINAIWSASLSSASMLLFSLYYIFAWIVIYDFSELYCRFRSIAVVVTLVGVAIASIWESTFLQTSGISIGGTRAQGTFNNSNQLGYFGLTSASCLVFGFSLRPAVRLKWLLGFGLLASFVVTMGSLSRAAVYSLAILALIWLYLHNVRGVTTLAVFLALAWIAVESEQVFSSRLFQDSGDMSESRGYERLWTFPQYLIFGAGEGDYRRVRLDGIGKHEIHSSYGTVLFCYGVIGSLLFGSVFWELFRIGGQRIIIYLLPVAAYSFTHNGLRFRILWVFLALLFLVGEHSGRRRAAASRPKVRQLALPY